MDKRVALEIGTIIDAYDYDNGIKENTRYRITEVIGYGGSGIIYSADKLTDGNMLVDKVCLKEYFPFSGAYRDMETYTVKAVDESPEFIADIKKRAVNEMSIGRKVRFKSENIVGNMQTVNIRSLLVSKRICLGGSNRVIDCNDGSMLFALMDDYSFACSIADMPDKIRTNSGRHSKLLNKGGDAFSFYAVLEITEKVLDTLALLHEKRIVHSDIQLRNVLFDTHALKNENEHISEALFCDFGASIDLDNASNSFYTDTVYVSKDFRAPEQNPEEKDLFGRISFATDIYQVGMMFWYLLSGQIESLATRRVRFDGDYTRFCEYGVKSRHIETVYQILLKATNHNPKNRYELNEFRDEIVKLKKWYKSVDLEIVKDYYLPDNLIERDSELDEISRLIDASPEPLFVWSRQKELGKETLLRMYANRENRRETIAHNVYIVDFKTDINTTISHLPINGDCNGTFDENIKVLDELDRDDVLVILGFNGKNSGTTPYDLMDEYYNRVLKIPARIVITTDYCMEKYQHNYMVKPLSYDLVIGVLDKYYDSVDHTSFIQKHQLAKAVEGNPKLLSMIIRRLKEDDTIVLENMISALESRPDNCLLEDEDSKYEEKTSELSKYLFYKSLYTFEELTINQKMILGSVLTIPSCGISLRLYMDSLQEYFAGMLSVEQIRSSLTQINRRGWIEIGHINNEMFVHGPEAFITEIIMSDKEVPPIDDSVLLLIMYDLLNSDNIYYENGNTQSWSFWCSKTIQVMNALKDQCNKVLYHKVACSAIKKRLRDVSNNNTNSNGVIVNSMLIILDSLLETDNYFSNYYLSMMLLDADDLDVLGTHLLEEAAKEHIKAKRYNEAKRCFDLLTAKTANTPDESFNRNDKIFPQVAMYPYSWEVEEGIFIKRQGSYVMNPANLEAGIAFYDAGEHQVARQYLIDSLKCIGNGHYALRQDSLEMLYKYLYNTFMKLGEIERADVLSSFNLV